MGFLEQLKLPSGRVRREHYNALLAALDASMELSGGAGVSGTFGSAGLLLAITGNRKRWVESKIVTAPPAGVPILPSQCRYGVQMIGKGEVMADMLPVYGRPCFGDDHHIYPAEVGHACWIFRNPQASGDVVAEMMVMTEQPYTGPC